MQLFGQSDIETKRCTAVGAKKGSGKWQKAVKMRRRKKVKEEADDEDEYEVEKMV